MWIELQQSLWTHRKTFALAEALSIDEVHAGGLVARLWCWALDNARADYEHRRGLLSDVVPRAIAGGAGWKGEPACFVAALIDAGFLERDGDDLVIHDWWDYSGRLLERRRRDRERKQKAAAAKAARKPRSRPKAIPQESARNSHVTLDGVTAENVVTVQYRTEESLNPLAPCSHRGEHGAGPLLSDDETVASMRPRERIRLEERMAYADWGRALNARRKELEAHDDALPGESRASPPLRRRG